MRKLAPIWLALAVLLSYAAPVQALFASGASCCKSHACCRRAHGAGWMSRAGCAGSCGCAFAAPVPDAAVAARQATVAHLPLAAAAPVCSRSAGHVRPPAPLFQRPPPLA